MSNLKLSKANDLLICTLYKNYLEKIEKGSSRSKARWFGSSNTIQENLLNNWSKDDVATACWELHSKGLLECSAGDNIAYTTYLTDDGIVYMENRLGNKIDKIIDYISKLKP